LENGARTSNEHKGHNRRTHTSMSPGVAGQIAVKNRSHSSSTALPCGSELYSRCGCTGVADQIAVKNRSHSSSTGFALWERVVLAMLLHWSCGPESRLKTAPTVRVRLCPVGASCTRDVVALELRTRSRLKTAPTARVRLCPVGASCTRDVVALKLRARIAVENSSHSSPTLTSWERIPPYPRSPTERRNRDEDVPPTHAAIDIVFVNRPSHRPSPMSILIRCSRFSLRPCASARCPSRGDDIPRFRTFYHLITLDLRFGYSGFSRRL